MNPPDRKSQVKMNRPSPCKSYFELQYGFNLARLGRIVEMMDIRFDGKVVLVTGGSRGIGRAIAQAFAGAGAMVMITARTQDTLTSAAHEISEVTSNKFVSSICSNAGAVDEPTRVIKATLEEFGRLDILVNNVATNPYFGPLISLDVARADKIIEVNLRSVLLWTQAAYELAWKDGTSRTSILNIASIGALTTEQGIGYYNTSKAGVLQLTRQLARELGPLIRVNAIAPGLVRTDFAKAIWVSREESIADKLPLKRIGEPEDISGTALFLSSDYASWITGQTFVVDGGALVGA